MMLSTPITSRRAMPRPSSWKGDEHVLVEDVAGEPVILEGNLGDVAVLFVGHVHHHDEVGRPGKLVLNYAHLQVGMPFENASEHHLGDGPAGPVVLGGPKGGGAGNGGVVGKGADARGPRADGAGVDAHWEASVFEGGPDGVELGLIVVFVLGLVGGDYEAGEAEFGAALDLLDGVGDVVEADSGGALELVGVGGAESRRTSR